MKYLNKHIVRLLLMALIVLPATTSCYDYHNQELAEDSKDVAQYINVTISVSAGTGADTRGPQGGEYGDGVEKGSERENKVNNITLIFYQDPADPTAASTTINTTSDNAKVVCVKKYQVHEPLDGELPATHSHKTSETDGVKANEVYYTTGRQRLSETSLEIGKTYKVLVVANTDVAVSVGDKIKDVRNKVATSIYTGTGIGTIASDFVMTSECDATVTLSNPTIDTSTGENRFIYYFDCIHIERLAARIDFWAKNATYTTEYDHNGYLYNISATDRFVLTSITPFNLNIGAGNEYLFKRVREGWTSDASTTYLGDESTTNWVVDPYTSGKTSSIHPVWMASTLTTVESSLANLYNITMAGSQNDKLTEDGYDNIIIAYPRENTLQPSSPLYYYATGLAFEGYYYANGAKTGGERRIYYHYLRHQGEEENSKYKALRSPLDQTVVCGNSPAMKYGVVRNNIYRVDISSITPDDKLILNIKVKKWDKFEHAVIYM